MFRGVGLVVSLALLAVVNGIIVNNSLTTRKVPSHFTLSEMVLVSPDGPLLVGLNNIHAETYFLALSATASQLREEARLYVHVSCDYTQTTVLSPTRVISLCTVDVDAVFTMHIYDISVSQSTGQLDFTNSSIAQFELGGSPLGFVAPYTIYITGRSETDKGKGFYALDTRTLAVNRLQVPVAGNMQISFLGLALEGRYAVAVTKDFSQHKQWSLVRYDLILGTNVTYPIVKHSLDSSPSVSLCGDTMALVILQQSNMVMSFDLAYWTPVHISVFPPGLEGDYGGAVCYGNNVFFSVDRDPSGFFVQYRINKWVINTSAWSMVNNNGDVAVVSPKFIFYSDGIAFQDFGRYNYTDALVRTTMK